MSIRHCNIISPAMGQSRAFGSDILRVIIEIGGVALYAAIISAIDLTEIMILDDDRQRGLPAFADPARHIFELLRSGPLIKSEQCVPRITGNCHAIPVTSPDTGFFPCRRAEIHLADRSLYRKFRTGNIGIKQRREGIVECEFVIPPPIGQRIIIPVIPGVSESGNPDLSEVV